MQPDFRTSKAWPIEEAIKLETRLKALDKKSAVFETGYGPSGAPHIGTFGEVARTTWVRHAFTELTGIPSVLIAFSDDMDALRKTPDNVPNPDLLDASHGLPLSRVPDPYAIVRPCPRCSAHIEELVKLGYSRWCSECGGTAQVSNGWPSYAHRNNALLRAFLDTYDFEYEFASSTEYYTSGRFNTALHRMAECHDEILEVILPTLGPDRRATYSPFMPIHPETGRVMQVKIEELYVERGEVVWRDPDNNQLYVTSIFDGKCKIQWKADWALRWYALGVDYEMSGKDLIDSVRLSSKICKILGGEPPINLTYELFLDEDGAKISKSKGNGLTIEQWLNWAPRQSLAQFMYQNPKSAKKLHHEVIPRAIDDWLANLAKLKANLDPSNPAWYIHHGEDVSNLTLPIVGFSTIINLATLANTDDPTELWAYLVQYHPGLQEDENPLLWEMVECACEYWTAWIAPYRNFRTPSAVEREALTELVRLLREGCERFEAIAPGPEREAAIQSVVYDAGRRDPWLTVNKDGSQGISREWFSVLYGIILGRTDGPRFSSTIAVLGIENICTAIEKTLTDND